MHSLDSKSRDSFLHCNSYTPSALTQHGWSVYTRAMTVVDRRNSGALRAGQQMFHDCRHRGGSAPLPIGFLAEPTRASFATAIYDASEASQGWNRVAAQPSSMPVV